MPVQYRYRISFCEFHSWHQCISLVCCADTHAISTWTLKEKFHISVWPCNCIFLYFFVWSSIICALSETLLGFYTENGASMCRVAKNWGVIQDRKEKDWSSFLKCLLTELGQHMCTVVLLVVFSAGIAWCTSLIDTPCNT